MENRVSFFAAFAVALLYVGMAAAQEPAKPEAQLRFDQAQQQELADVSVVAPLDSVTFARPFVYKLNRKRVSEAKAYDAVTLWNVRRVGIKNRRMRLSDTTRCEKVRLLKFFIEKDSKKGAKPHLLGNVAGCMWGSVVRDEQTQSWRNVPHYISAYTLADEMDAARKAASEPLFKVPEEVWRQLSPDAVYVLDGEAVPSSVFFFAEGLILRTLEILTDPETMALYHTDKGVVRGDLYPGGRLPLVVLNNEPSTVDVWLKMCRAGAFSMDSAVPLRYFYMLPVEAVRTYGKRGMYGAICIDVVR